MKRFAFLSASFAGVLVLTACNGPLTGDVTGMEQSSAMTESSSSIASDVSSAAMSDAASSVESAAMGARVIDVGVTNWEFNPKTITVKKGEKIVLRLSDVDGIHSFLAADLGLNVRLNPGETKDVEIPTDKAGTFSFRCGVPCGEGHKEMTGTIVIE